MEKPNNPAMMFWRRLFSALVDLAIIYSLSYVVHRLVIQVVFINSFSIFSIIWLLYYFGSPKPITQNILSNRKQINMPRRSA
jgi:hypothetical protein